MNTVPAGEKTPGTGKDRLSWRHCGRGKPQPTLLLRPRTGGAVGDPVRPRSGSGPGPSRSLGTIALLRHDPRHGTPRDTVGRAPDAAGSSRPGPPAPLPPGGGRARSPEPEIASCRPSHEGGCELAGREGWGRSRSAGASPALAGPDLASRPRVGVDHSARNFLPKNILPKYSLLSTMPSGQGSRRRRTV